MPKLTFGQRLKRLRESFRFEQTGLSQSELAERAGVAKQQIQQWEAGRHVPSLGMAAKLARALGVTVDQLGGGMNAIWLENAAEIWITKGNQPGPTGRFARVIYGDVFDAGGRLLFHGEASRCARYASTFPEKTRLVPTEWEACSGHVAGADNVWEMVPA